MKNFVLKSIFVLMMFFVILGCSSDSSSDSCAPIFCQNEGISTADCGCDCLPGYSGINCATQLTPTKIKITKFRVTMFNNQDGSSNWDSGSTADIFIQLGNYVSEIYYPNVLSDGSNHFDFIPSTPIEIINVTAGQTVYLGDLDLNDSPSNPNDQMAAINFTPYQSINRFPATLSLSDYSTPIPFRVELTLSYEW